MLLDIVPDRCLSQPAAPNSLHNIQVLIHLGFSQGEGVRGMAVIVMASSKGGAGKSTLTLVLAQALDALGATVTIIDADRNKPIDRWKTGNSKTTIEVVSDVTESNIVQLIRQNSGHRQFVLVDPEGTANRLVSRAISQAAMVLIPLQASELDSNEAGRAVGLIQEEEEVSYGRTIPFRVILTRTSPLIATRIENSIYKVLKKNNIPLMQTRLNERQAYKAIFSQQVTLDELIDEGGLTDDQKKKFKKLLKQRELAEQRAATDPNSTEVNSDETDSNPRDADGTGIAEESSDPGSQKQEAPFDKLDLIISGLAAAKENAEALANEIIDLIPIPQNSGEAAHATL
jgi:chromosome partitioning protein